MNTFKLSLSLQNALNVDICRDVVSIGRLGIINLLCIVNDVINDSRIFNPVSLLSLKMILYFLVLHLHCLKINIKVLIGRQIEETNFFSSEVALAQDIRESRF